MPPLSSPVKVCVSIPYVPLPNAGATRYNTGNRRSMMTETIATLKDERARLLARLEQLDGLLRRYDDWEREAAVVLSGATKPPAKVVTVGHVHEFDTAGSITPPKGTPLPEFEAAATKMFEDTDTPLPRAEAFGRLGSYGVAVVGKEPLNVMTTRFNRMDNIINLKGHGYWLKSRPYPLAGYAPDDERETGSVTEVSHRQVEFVEPNM
jgi:hypothetical protein